MFRWISKIFKKDKKSPEKYKIDQLGSGRVFPTPPPSFRPAYADKYSSMTYSDGYYAREKTEKELYEDIDLE